VAFISDASNLVSGDTNNRSDIFVRDRLTNKTVGITVGQDLYPNDISFSISANGESIAFSGGDGQSPYTEIFVVNNPFLDSTNLNPSNTVNRLAREINANGAVRKYAYDAVGNITSITDRDGTIQKFTYDKLNRRTQEQWFDVLGNLTRNIVSTYNAAGELTSITDPDSTYSYTYDLDGRMLSVNNEGTPNLPTTIMSYSYDNVGNVLSMTDTINGSLGIATTREYDALNRLTVNAQGNKQVDYAYNAISQVTNKYRYSDNNLVAETNHIYDQSDRLTNIIHSNGTGANTIASYSQTYDEGDRITGVTSNDGNSSYTYDDTNQLISGEYDFQDDENYSYDGNGNRTNDGYVTGVNNQLLEDNKYLYEYDLVGNRTKRTDKSTNEVMEYRWDIRDRLTGITVKNDLGEIIRTAEYTYDAYNQRIAKTVDTDGDGSLAAVTERFVYGRDQNIALVFDENGNVNHRYLFGDGVDQIEADESNGNVLWALTDHLGSVRDVVDDSGTVLNHIVYDAFGGVTSQTDESVVFRYGYTARELDAESGLQYNRARYLDSFTGRFISEDPISFQGGDSNLYRYVFNSPTKFIDPTGEIAFLPILGYIAATAVIGAVAGAGINSARQGLQILEGSRQRFDINEVGASAAVGALLAPILGKAPLLAVPLAIYTAGQGLKDTFCPDKGQPRRYLSGPFDIATALLPFAPKKVTNLSFKLTKNRETIRALPQAKYGHFGFSFNKGKTIFGFGPENPNPIGLKNRESFPGILSNDTTTFKDASQLGIKITESQHAVSAIKFYSALIQAKIDFALGSRTGKQYQLPPKQGSFPQGCYNCVSYPASIGLPASTNGKLP
jgi:RHS repeat-associated protein